MLVPDEVALACPDRAQLTVGAAGPTALAVPDAWLASPAISGTTRTTGAAVIASRRAVSRCAVVAGVL